MRNGVKRKAAITLAVMLGLVALYTLAGFFLAPWLVQRELARAAGEAGLEASIAELRINPFTYTVEAKGVTVKEKSGTPVATVSRLYADFTLASLVQDAIRFAALAVEGADVSLVIERDGRSNFARIADRLSQPGAPQKNEPGRAFRVDDLRIRDATVRYADRSGKAPIELVVGPVDLEAADVSTLANREGRYKLAAALPDKARVAGEGSLTLQPLSSAGRISVSRLDFATAWPFLRERMRTAPLRGIADIAASYRVEQRDSGIVVSVTDGDINLENVSIAMPGAERPLLALARAQAKNVRYDGAAAALAFPSVELAKGAYTAIVDRDGRFNWAQIWIAEEEQKPASRWNAGFETVKLTDIAIRYEDHTRRSPIAVDVARGSGALKLAMASGGEVLATLAEDIRLDLADVALSRMDAPEPLARLAAASLDGGRIDVRGRSIAVASAAFRGGSATAIRNAEGAIPLLEAFAPARPADAPPDEPSGPPWRFGVGTVLVENTEIALGDAGFQPAIRYDVTIEKIALRDIAPGGDRPVAFEASAKIAQGGALSASGTASQDFSRVTAKADVKDVALVPLQPLVGRHLTLAVRSGTASTSATIDYAQDRKPLVRVAGGFRIGDVVIDDARTKERFISWKALTGESVALTLSPDRLDIKEVVLDQPQTAIIVSKDRKVNLAQVTKDSGEAPPAKPQAPAQRAPASAEGPPFPVRIGRLQLRNGTIDFADYSLVLPFSTRVVRASGSALGLSTDPQARTELKFGGRIEPSGYATAEGALNLLHPTDFMDISVKFQNVAMPPLSPYTATFAGRKIDGGRLWLDLDYKIVDQQLAGENKIVMENIQLGERVEAPGAMDLPLELAISLLKDSEGRIRMAIPVSGDVDNPQFSYGTLIREAIVSALGRLVTAPFRALASLFGGGTSAEEMSKVRFSPGSARLYPPQREALQKVAKALHDRPQLKVVVHGAYDPARDAERLKRTPVRRSLAEAMGQKVEPGEDPGPIAFSDPETQQAIEKLFVANAGREALRAFEAQHAAQNGKAPDRRAYYEALFERLVERHPLPDTALQQLAGARAQAIAAFLAESGVDKSRIEIGSLRTVTDSAEPTIDAQLALAAAGGRS